MERRAASHTEEEEMNQRRKLLNAARRGDAKAISKLFELYQVRVLSGDQLAKVNQTSTYLVPVKPTKGGKSAAQRPSQKVKPLPARASKPAAKTTPAKSATKVPSRKPAKNARVAKRKAKHR